MDEHGPRFDGLGEDAATRLDPDPSLGRDHVDDPAKLVRVSDEQNVRTAGSDGEPDVIHRVPLSLEPGRQAPLDEI
jgi:hypothetical protein